MSNQQQLFALDHEAIQRIELVKRTNATKLDLAGLGLTELPDAILGLTQLTELNLINNRLTTLPDDISRLNALTVLHLSTNRLAALPEAIGRLASLTHLCLLNNQLTALPESVGRLSVLTELYLYNNQIASLPATIGDLAALNELLLQNNQLAALPEDITRLDNLRTLLLHGNPRLHLPPEALGPTYSEVQKGRRKPAKPSDILRYYFTRQAGPRRMLAEAKMLVVGQGAVGKTSLIKFLVEGRTCDEGEAKTDKIAVSPWSLPILRPSGGKPLDIALNVWDFGGQEIYHATHQFFLSKRSLYLLILDARLTEEQNNIHYWFQVIRSYGGDSPVLVVINKSEQHRLDLNEARLRTEYGEQFSGVCRVSCKCLTARDGLIGEIRDRLQRLTHLFDELPESYFIVKKKLEARARKENYLSYHAYRSLCIKNDLKGQGDQGTLIRFLHDLGVVLNFNDPDNPYRLQDTAILNPEWVTRGVYAILNDTQLAASDGVLTAADLARILGEYEYPQERRQVIVGMMEKFELCFDLDERRERWLVPGLLPRGEPPLEWREAESLNFQYHYDVLPIGLIGRFIVRTHRYRGPNPVCWRTGVVLQVDGNAVLVRGDTARGRVFVTVQGPEARRRAALAVARHEFGAIHATIPRLHVTERVPLDDDPSITVEYGHLCRLEEAGETAHWPEGAPRRYDVPKLLDGVSTPQERQLARQRLEITQHHHHYAPSTHRTEVPMTQNSGNIVNSTVTNSGVMNWGTISGQVRNAVRQLPPNPAAKGPDLAAALEAVLAAIDAAVQAKQLSPEDAADAGAEAQAVADGAKEPAKAGVLEAVNKAVRGLGRIAASVTTLAAPLATLKDAVKGWFGG